MSNLAKLLKKQEELNEQIMAAELAEKNKNRVERLAVRLISKHGVLLTSDPKAVETKLDEAITAVAVSFK